MKHPSTSRQRGVFTVITAIGAVLLVVILGFVVDGTRLMVIQGELQNATDACALAAAAELNGQPGATFRAAAAGSQVGGALNKKNFQGVSAAIAPSDVTFSTSLNGTYVGASGSSVNYRFAQCTATHSGWINMFMGLVGSGSDEPLASSKAGQQQTRKICVLPLAFLEPTGAGDVHVQLRFTDHVNAPPAKTDIEYLDLIKAFGSCNTPTDLTTIQVRAGIDSAVLQAWYENYPTYYDASGNSSRRFAIPVIKSSGQVTGWGCFQLKSILGSIQVNYLGPAGSLSSKCVVSGITGFDALGPPAPVLVR
jgi:Flp pilus assembly protein TadG